MWKNGSKVLQINFSDLLSHDPEKAIEICNCYERYYADPWIQFYDIKAAAHLFVIFSSGLRKNLSLPRGISCRVNGMNISPLSRQT